MTADRGVPLLWADVGKLGVVFCFGSEKVHLPTLCFHTITSARKIASLAHLPTLCFHTITSAGKIASRPPRTTDALTPLRDPTPVPLAPYSERDAPGPWPRFVAEI
jgi:hypothetical protein